MSIKNTRPDPARRRALRGVAGGAVALAVGAAALAPAGDAAAKTLGEVDRDVPRALDRLYAAVPGARALYRRASGVLVFPEIVKGSFVIGAANGKGALLIGGRTDSHWRYVAASFGFQAGLQETSQALFFMTPEALDSFLKSNGIEVGLDAEITVIDTGAEVAVDTFQNTKPIIAIVYGRKGLLGGASLKGGKYERITR